MPIIAKISPSSNVHVNGVAVFERFRGEGELESLADRFTALLLLFDVVCCDVAAALDDVVLDETIVDSAASTIAVLSFIVLKSGHNVPGAMYFI